MRHPITPETLRSNPKVEIVDDERLSGNGVIITLKKGWSFDPLQDNRVQGFDWVREALSAVLGAQPFDGPFDP